MAGISIRKVGRKFGDYTALHEIDLEIADQEFMVLLGASGCGKTTLLRIIAGLDYPNQGEVHINGERVDQLPPRKRGIAMVFQNYAVFPHLKVFDNIGFGLKMKKLPAEEIRSRVHKTAELMHIENLLDRYSGQLSGGQRQRVAVARALAMEPEVLLMDEPLSNLDALLRLEMRAELKGVLAQSNTTTIYVTHDQVEAMSLADRIAVMHQGKIVQAATPIEVYRNPATRFVGSFIGNPPMNFLQATRQSANKWQIGDELSLAGPDVTNPKLEMAIRPEDMQLSSAGIAVNVKVVEPLGPHLLVTGDADGTLLRAVLDSDAKIRPQERIHLQPVADRIRWFDPETQRAVEH